MPCNMYQLSRILSIVSALLVVSVSWASDVDVTPTKISEPTRVRARSLKNSHFGGGSGGFGFSNILYSVGYCHNPGKGCPPPHCKGPLRPDICNFYDSNGNFMFDSYDQCGGNANCQATLDYYNGDSSSNGSGGGNNSDAAFSSNYDISSGSNGGTQRGNFISSEASFNPFMYVIAGLAMLSLIVAVIFRRRRDVEEEDDLDRELQPAGLQIESDQQEERGSEMEVSVAPPSLFKMMIPKRKRCCKSMDAIEMQTNTESKFVVSPTETDAASIVEDASSYQLAADV